jgi:SAM-dependent methyltransferase
MTSKLYEHKAIWEKKKIIRTIYTDWYKQIISDSKDDGGKTVELGAGTGNFKAFKPDVIASDIEECDWLDMSFDAHFMPFENSSISNIVMIDVLHHLSNPVKFLHEAYRVLNSGGRICIIEPFPTSFSLMIYRRFHPEPFIFDVDYFSKDEIENKNPWDSNQAIAYLLFYKNLERFNETFASKFRIVKKKRISCILYPASGGFENKAMIPDFIIPVFKIIEFLCIPFRFIFAFRCYIVLEKK